MMNEEDSQYIINLYDIFQNNEISYDDYFNKYKEINHKYGKISHHAGRFFNIKTIEDNIDTRHYEVARTFYDQTKLPNHLKIYLKMKWGFE